MNAASEWPGRPALCWYLILLLVLGGVQSTLVGTFSLWGAQPDLPLTLALTAALLSDAAVGSVAGLVSGLVTGALVGQSLGAFLASRSLAGFVAGGFTARLYGSNVGVLLLGVFIGSVVAGTVLGLLSPRLTLLHWLRVTLIGSAFNALLALPLSFILRRCGWGR